MPNHYTRISLVALADGSVDGIGNHQQHEKRREKTEVHQ
jgi:hypothetical protein